MRRQKPQDREKVERVVNNYTSRGLVKSGPTHPQYGMTLMFVAPAGGIPKASGTTVSSADCVPYKIDDGTLVPRTVFALDGTTVTRKQKVYNVSGNDIQEGMMFLGVNVAGEWVGINATGFTCESLCDCPIFASDLDCTPDPPDPANCCEGCDFSLTEVTNMTVTSQFTTGKTYTQNGTGVWQGGQGGSICEFSIPLLGDDAQNYTGALTYEGPKNGSTLESSWTLVLVRTSDGNPEITLNGLGAWKCGDSPALTFQGPLGSDTGSCSLTTSGASCGCCVDCPYETDAITNFSASVDTYTLTQDGPSYWVDLGGQQYCEFQCVADDSRGYRPTVSFKRKQGGIDWTAEFIDGDLGGTVILENTSFPDCAGTVSLTLQSGAGIGSGSFDVASNGTCPAAATFFRSNPDIVVSGCNRRDAQNLMQTLDKERLVIRVGMISKILYREGGPSREDIAERLNNWIEANK